MSRGARSASSCSPGMKRIAVVVDQERAFTPHRLGHQRLLALRALAQPEHGRVELHELQVTHLRAGPQRQRHAVTGRHARVGGGGVHLPDAAGGEDHRPAADRADAVALPLAHHVQGDAGDGAVLGGQQVDDEGVLDQPDVVGPLDRGDERPLDLRAGGVAAGVRDPVAVVPAFPAQREVAVDGVEPRTQLDQVPDGVRSFRDQDADSLRIAQARRRRRGCPGGAPRASPPDRGRPRSRPGPTGSSRRRRRPWSPRARIPAHEPSGRRSARRSRTRSPPRRRYRSSRVPARPAVAGLQVRWEAP